MELLHAQAERLRGMESHFPSEDALREEEAQWRRYGRARRKELLEIDETRGGTQFKMNVSCSVHRYFQVANRALEQFHNMYRLDSNLEETYIMGYRMISFLTECLPSHPGFRSPEVFESRMQCRRELELVQKCLDDIALRIDEDQCNLFADGFDPIVDDSDDDSVSESAPENWVAFGGWTDDELKTKPRKADSPTNTVATSGTGSVDAYDFSSSDESGDAERQLDFSEYCEESSSPRPLYTMDLGTDFLERIAREDVRYETDSDAADSWAQDNASVAPSASSASGITCDPARLAFRELLNRVPRIKLVKKRRDLRVRQNVDKNTIDESAVDSEIQKYLESEDQKEDPYDVIENSLERLKHSSQSKSPERDERSESSGSSDLASTFEQKEVEPKTGQSEFVLEAEDEWVSFDIGRQPVQF